MELRAILLPGSISEWKVLVIQIPILWPQIFQIRPSLFLCFLWQCWGAKL